MHLACIIPVPLLLTDCLYADCIAVALRAQRGEKIVRNWREQGGKKKNVFRLGFLYFYFSTSYLLLFLCFLLYSSFFSLLVLLIVRLLHVAASITLAQIVKNAILFGIVPPLFFPIQAKVPLPLCALFQNWHKNCLAKLFAVFSHLMYFCHSARCIDINRM